MLFRFEGIPQKTKSGDNSAEETPVPISNTAVKLRALMILGGKPPGKVGRCRFWVKKKLHNGVASFFSVSVQKWGQKEETGCGFRTEEQKPKRMR